MKDQLRHLWNRLCSIDTRSALTAVALYGLITAVLFYPIPLQLNSVLTGFDGRDGWEHAWWLWFAKHLLLEGRGLNDLYLLNHPVGLQHPYQWSLAAFSLLAGLVGVILPPAATFNVMALGSFVLCGLAAYHLCRHVTGSHLAAIIGGTVFAFCPNRMGHALGGYLPQLTAFLYPWYGLLLIRALEQPSLRRGIGLGLLAAVAALIWPMHIAYFMLPLTLVIAGAELLRLRGGLFSEQRLMTLGVGLAVSLAIALPFFAPLVVGRFRDNLSYLSTHGIVQHSTELLAFFTPSPYHPVLAPLGLVPAFAKRVIDEIQTLRWDSAYVGVVPVLLGLWGLLRSKPRPWRWFTLALGAAVLSLGPVLILAGEPLTYITDGYESRVLLPYAIVRQIPLLDLGRTPGRLNTTSMLGLGVLAAFGASRVLSKLENKRWKAQLAVSLIVAMIAFEYVAIWPFPAGKATIPPVIQQVAEHSDGGAILHVPMDRRAVNNRALFFQTATQEPVVGGVVLRTLPTVPPWQETIEGLVIDDGDHDVVPRPTEAQRRAWLRHLEIEWVILDRFFPEDEARYQPGIETVLGPAVLEDDILTAFSVPTDGPSLEVQHLYTIADLGWHAAEEDGGIWRRWMYADGTLYIYSVREDTGALRFNVDSHLDFPLLELYHDEQLVDAFVVGDRTTYESRSITLNQGMNVFRFHAPHGCPQVLDDPSCWSDALLTIPADTQPPCDAQTTCRTFVFDSVSFVPENDLTRGETTEVNFGDTLRLRSWAVEASSAQPGQTLAVTMTWEAMAEPTTRHVVFAHLVSPEGKLVAQHDDAPVGSVAPRSAWPVGAILTYPIELQVPADASPGEYGLLAGVYVWPSLERLPVVAGASPVENSAVQLTKVQVTP